MGWLLGGLSHVSVVIHYLHRYLATKGGVYVAIEAVNFLIGIIGRIISGLVTTLIIRIIDRFSRKNNRQCH